MAGHADVVLPPPFMVGLQQSVPTAELARKRPLTDYVTSDEQQRGSLAEHDGATGC